MKSKALSVVALVVPLAAADAAWAQQSEGGFYVGLRANGSIVDADDISGQGFTGSIDAQNDSDTVAGIAAVVGYKWDYLPIRTEVEGGYRFRFDLDVQDQCAPVVDYEADLEWRNESDFTPFIGGSIGYARNDADTDRVVVPTQATTSKSNATDNLAWGVMAGVDWEFIDHWSAGLAYRYIDLGEVETGTFSGGDGVSADDYTSHDLLLTFTYRF